MVILYIYIYVCVIHLTTNGPFTLYDLDTNSDSDLHCKPNGYIALCRTFHTSWSRIQTLTANYRNRIRIGIPICECK